MSISSLQYKKVAIIGFGVEGLSSAKFFVKHKAYVTVFDKKEEKDFDEEAIKALRKLGVKFVFGENCLDNPEKFDLVLRSPGIRRDAKELKGLEAKGASITSQTKIFFDLCPGKIIGITGTKGKGTTSTLIYQMLLKQRLEVYLGGNIGKPPLDFLDTLNDQSWTVLELSSFQLQDMTSSPHIAIMLMTTSEHLDYHKDVYEYIDAKRNILRFQKKDDLAIINRDYPVSHESDIYTNAKLFQVSRERECRNGCFVQNDSIWVEREGEKQKIIDTKDIRLLGKHNLENVCAAVMAASIVGVSKANIAKTVKAFKGLEHRLQFVGEIDKARYYDDSFSTIPETTIVAIEAFNKPKVLILGGSGKNSDFTQLINFINKAQDIRGIIGIGLEWKNIKSKIKNKKLRIVEGCKDMKEIVRAASSLAKPGDVVLLSPACASFDMFKNYKDRGEQFKKEVNQLISNS
ncbi:MAG: UDP-N-acetylmuramoyl-L-alanine--D-glutamate ligase [Candidatus Levybacteria bacterium]|nr:UDP-N-acetylmuramoyl-L-alanine--D-glutamate ligase [Candidatus Levybacteria bacterium]